MSIFLNKVAIITGSSNGIGRATALLFAEDGAKVTITGRNAERLNETLDLITSAGVPVENVNSVIADVTTTSGQELLINSTIKKFGKLDILVNNAGAAIPDKNGEMGLAQDIETYDKTFDVNVRSVIELTRKAKDYLISSRGEIVNVSSMFSGSHANCQKCQQPFVWVKMNRVVFKPCNHHVCITCHFHLGQSNICVLCGDEYDFENFILKIIGIPPNIIQGKTVSSKTENPEENIHKCAECETRDSEQNMHLCKTCYELKFKDPEDVMEHALCSTCAIKKHMRKVHQTVDVFPYLRAYNFRTQSTEISLKSEELKSARDSLNGTLTDFKNLSINASENYDKLIDIAQRCKSTKHQVEFFEKMKMFINESMSTTSKTESELKSRVEELKKQLKNMEEWCESRKKDCLDDSEIVQLDH